MNNYINELFFPNGYGALIKCTNESMGGTRNLFEITIIRGTKNNYTPVYDSSISTGVIGNCDFEKVNHILNRIKKLPFDQRVLDEIKSIQSVRARLYMMSRL